MKMRQKKLQFKEKLNHEEGFTYFQEMKASEIDLSNRFSISEIKYISGVDLAYWSIKNREFAVCCISTIDYKTKKLIEIKYLEDEVKIPYVAGYLSFRELPIILKTYEFLETKPDLVMFGGCRKHVEKLLIYH